ncbi:MAG: hypothetical protein J6N93_06760, partial [Clostridia bacterium]|nr:hypothetical protein [Clostridia bacterium]
CGGKLDSPSYTVGQSPKCFNPSGFPLRRDTYIGVIIGIFLLGTVVEFARSQLIQKPFNYLLKKRNTRFEKIDKIINLVDH